MTGAALLAGYAVLVGVAGPHALRRLRWLDRTPRLGVAVWLAALWSMVAGLLLAGTVAALNSRAVHDLAADLVQACIHVFHHAYGNAPAAIAGLAMASLLAGRLLLQASAIVYRNRGTRRRHLAAIDIVGRHEPGLDVTLIDHPAIIAYCVPSRRGRVVVTSAAARELDPEQLAAVVAHERAHLAGRHHLLLTAVGVLGAALPFLPLARRAPAAMEHLVERLADERAARDHDRHDVASALLAAGAAKAPAGAMGIGGGSVHRRVLALLDPALPVRWSWRLAGAATAVALAAGPFVLVAIPSLGVALADHCPLPV